MKTLNDKIHIFTSNKAAEKFYDKSSSPACLIKWREHLYVDLHNPEDRESAIKNWPQLYTLIKSK